jgi:hypothetical protein
MITPQQRWNDRNRAPKRRCPECHRPVGAQGGAWPAPHNNAYGHPCTYVAPTTTPPDDGLEKQPHDQFDR